MSRSTLQGLGCLPKSFPDVEKYDEGVAQVSYLATDLKENTSRRNPDFPPTGDKPEVPRAPHEGRAETQHGPEPKKDTSCCNPHSSTAEDNPEVLRAPQEGRDRDDSDQE